jgi:8-oxo-dGTP pyrophosphatase MutT (NUDIX family)
VTEHEYTVLGSEERFRGPIFTVVTDRVAMPGGRSAARDYMRHIGAVAVVAIDDRNRVVLVRQYRHPIGAYLWELPAGLVDVAGEAPVDTAARELAEEADLHAGVWQPLVETHLSPGVSDEMIRIFLARELTDAPHPHLRYDEEAGLTVHRVDLAEALAMALRGEITNAACLVGLFAAARVLGA